MNVFRFFDGFLNFVNCSVAFFPRVFKVAAQCRVVRCLKVFKGCVERFVQGCEEVFYALLLLMCS